MLIRKKSAARQGFIAPCLHRPGFTLTEFFIAFTIAAFLGIITVSFIRIYQPTASLRTAARLVASDIRHTSSLASTVQISHELRINALNGQYSIVRLSVPEIVVSERTLDPSISFASTTFPGNVITFNTLGAAAVQGTVTLEYTDGAQTVLDVRPSGYVRINE